MLPSTALVAGYPEAVLDAVTGAFSARSGRAVLVPQTWNSDTWAPFWTLLAVKESSTYWSVVPAGSGMVTVLPVDGFQV